MHDEAHADEEVVEGISPIHFAVGRPHTIAVAAILIVLFSWLALTNIPVQLKPTVDTPAVNVTTRYRGASAVEVEEQVTRELEDVLQSTEGLVEMTSTSAESSSNITLEFATGADVNAALIDVVTKLSAVPPLPEEADEPVAAIAAPMGADLVMWIIIASHYETDYLRRLVRDEVQAKLERVPGVAGLLIVGGSEREIQIRIDLEALVARGVTLDGLMGALGQGNQNVRGGTVETIGRRLVVRTVGKAVVPSELGNLIVAETDGGSVRLSEVAEIVDGYTEAAGFVNMNGVPSVGIGVRRQVGANVVDLIHDCEDMVDKLNQGFTNRGIDIWLNPIYRETTYIEAAMGFVKGNLLLGAALAIGVLLVFLRSPRSVLIVTLTIPVSLLSVFLVMHLLGRTLNVISLAGIAFASGMVVDNAIVVLENVFRHLELGKSPRRAAIDGGREVWGGVLASTLTTIAVFVPILLQQDEASQLFRDIALAISAAVGASLLVALAGVPVLSSLLFRGAGSGQPSGGLAGAARGPIARTYGRFCAMLERSIPGAAGIKLGFVLLVIAGAIISLRLAPPAEYLPTGNRNLVMFFASPIPGTRPEAVRDAYAPFEKFVMEQPETERMFSVSGGFNGGGIILKDEFANAQGISEFYTRLFRPASMIPGWQFFVPVRSSLFDDPGKQFEVELSGPDFESLAKAEVLVKDRLQRLPGVTFVRSSLTMGRPELHVEVDEARAKDLDLDVAEIGRVVETVVAGRRLTTMIDSGREVDVNVLAPQEIVSSLEDLEGVRFLAADGQAVTLGSVATVTRTTGPESIRRLERERNVLLTVNIAEDAPLETVVASVENDVFPEISRELGSAYTLAVGGAADKLKTTLASLTSGLGLSVLIIYLLLVSLFRSWISPFVILVTVPLALSGGLLGIRVAASLTGGEVGFDVLSMLGFVILAGLVVNNAILIVHQANNFMAEGYAPRRALATSAQSRLRPILMSVVTTVFGMMPLALGGGAGAELYQGLGAVIVGGLVVSTVFTLFVVPTLLSLGHDISRSHGVRGGAVAEPELPDDVVASPTSA